MTEQSWRDWEEAEAGGAKAAAGTLLCQRRGGWTHGHRSQRWWEGEQRLQPSASRGCSRIPASVASPRSGAVTTGSASAAGSGRGVVSHPAFTRCHDSKASTEVSSAQHATFLPPGTCGGHCRVLPASCLHLGRKGSSKHPSHTTGSGSRAVPTTPSLRGSLGPLQMAPVHPAGGSPSTRRGPRRHRSQHREPQWC